jgi:hypothetical protein
MSLDGKMDTKTIGTRLVGNLDAYVLGESFDDYMIIANNYFELNNLSDEKFKVRLLVNQIGSAANNKIIKAIKT